MNHYTKHNEQEYATTRKLEVQIETNLALYERAYRGFDILQV